MPDLYNCYEKNYVLKKDIIYPAISFVHNILKISIFYTTNALRKRIP